MRVVQQHLSAKHIARLEIDLHLVIDGDRRFKAGNGCPY